MDTDTLRVSAYFTVKNAAAAIDFYRAAFGAEEIFRLTDPLDGRVGHAELRIGQTLMMLSDEYPDFDALSPDTIGGSPVTFHLATTSTDQMLARATTAGAVVLRPATDQSYRQRVAMILDPFGHRWMLSETIENLPPKDMQQRWEEATKA